MSRAESMGVHKLRLLDDDTVADVHDAIVHDLNANVGDTIYKRARALARRTDHSPRYVGIALEYLDREDGLSITQSNPDAQQSRWTITREAADE